MSWSASHQFRFDTSLVVKAIDDLVFCNLGVSKEVAFARCKLVPPRDQFLALLTSLRMLHTTERLVRKGILPNDANICALCLDDKESDSHLLIHCPRVYPLWLYALSVWNV